MKLDVKNLALGAVGETDNLEINLDDYKISDDLIATSIKGKIKLTRLEDSILTEISGGAALKVPCDRCLIDFELDIPFDVTREYFFGGYREDGEELLVSKHFEVEVEEPMREEIILAIPVKKLCREGCRGLCAHCGADLNEGKCKCSRTENKKV